MERFASDTASSLLWIVRSRCGRMGFHLLGTAHTRCGPPWMPAIEEILSVSEWTAVECLPGVDPTQSPRVSQVCVSAALVGNPDALDLVVRASRKAGLTPSGVAALPVIDAWKLLLAAALVRENWSETVDAAVLRAATRASARVVPLEGSRAAFRRLDELDVAVQREALVGLAEVMLSSREVELVLAMNALKRAYIAGLFDGKHMALTVRPGFPAEVVQILLHQRDAAFTREILVLAGNGPGMVAIGAGHLAGVLDRLERSGFEVAPVALCAP